MDRLAERKMGRVPPQMLATTTKQKALVTSQTMTQTSSARGAVGALNMCGHGIMLHMYMVDLAACIHASSPASIIMHALKMRSCMP